MEDKSLNKSAKVEMVAQVSRLLSSTVKGAVKSTAHHMEVTKAACHSPAGAVRQQQGKVPGILFKGAAFGAKSRLKALDPSLATSPCVVRNAYAECMTPRPHVHCPCTLNASLWSREA